MAAGHVTVEISDLRPLTRSGCVCCEQTEFILSLKESIGGRGSPGILRVPRPRAKCSDCLLLLLPPGAAGLLSGGSSTELELMGLAGVTGSEPASTASG